MIHNFFFGVTVGCLIGFATHFIFRSRKSRHSEQPTEELQESKSDVVIDEDNAYKLALIINDELKMGKGKVIAQCAHAAAGVYETYYDKKRRNFDTWEQQGKSISVFKVSDTSMLKDLKKIALANNMVNCIIVDAGRTQIARGSVTVLGIGPETEESIKMITENLLPYT